MFHIRTEGVGHTALDGIDSFVELLRDHIAHVIDDVGVIAGPAKQGIDAGAAVESVVATSPREDIRGTVAGQDVVERIARPINRRATGEREVLDMVAQGPGERTLNRVGALIQVFQNRIARPNHIGVIAQAAGQHVRRAVAG